MLHHCRELHIEWGYCAKHRHFAEAQMNELATHLEWLTQAGRQISTVDYALVFGVMVINLAVKRFGMWPYTLISFPGTATHELLHYVAAAIFFARPSFPSLWPKRQGDSWVMGSVAFVPNLFNVIPIALAPLALLPAAYWAAGTYMHPAHGWEYLLYGWVIGNMVQACIPSGQDWKVAAPALIVLGIGAAVWVYWLPVGLRDLAGIMTLRG